MAYVLNDGESAPPPGLRKAFADSVRAAELTWVIKQIDDAAGER